jgi:hypothetical protein
VPAPSSDGEQPVGGDAEGEVLLDELRQEHLLRRELEHEHDGEERDRHPEPRDPGDVARPGADRPERALGRLRRDGPGTASGAAERRNESASSAKTVAEPAAP